MTEITKEDLQKNVDSLLAQVGQDADYINWPNIQKIQKEFSLKVIQTVSNIQVLKDNCMKNYVNVLRELKPLDTKSMLKELKEDKANDSQLKDIYQFITKAEDGSLKINIQDIKKQAEKKQAEFTDFCNKLV